MHEKSILVVDTPKQVENGAFSCVGGALDDGREVGMGVDVLESVKEMSDLWSDHILIEG